MFFWSAETIAACRAFVSARVAGRVEPHGTDNTQAFAAYLAPLKRTRWYVYAKRPPELL